MPYFVGNILEIPVTTTQDYSLFHILSSYSTALWEEQCRLILSGHGLISVIVHPDYVINKKSNNAYRRLLAYLAQMREKMFVWTTLPSEINKWWRMRSEMKLVTDGLGWRIDGEGKERARIACAHLADGQLKYSFDSSLLPGLQQKEMNGQNRHPKAASGLQRSPDSVTTS